MKKAIFDIFGKIYITDENVGEVRHEYDLREYLKLDDEKIEFLEKFGKKVVDEKGEGYEIVTYYFWGDRCLYVDFFTDYYGDPKKKVAYMHISNLFYLGKYYAHCMECATEQKDKNNVEIKRRVIKDEN